MDPILCIWVGQAQGADTFNIAVGYEIPCCIPKSLNKYFSPVVTQFASLHVHHLLEHWCLTELLALIHRVDDQEKIALW